MDSFSLIKEETMKHHRQQTFGFAFVILAFLFAMTLGAAAQDVTHPPTTKTVGEATHEVKPTYVQNAEVIHVSGHEIVVKLENGKLELLNLGQEARFQVDGKNLTVHELTPGTKLSQDVHTITTPQEVTTLRTLNGRVWHVNRPHHLIVSLPDGGTKEFTVPDGTVFRIGGEDKTVFDLKKGMNFSATVLTVEPVQSATSHTVVTGQAPARPDVAFEGPTLIEERREVPTVAANVEQPPLQELPKTASLVPLTGTLGFLSLALWAGVRIFRSKIRIGS
jgi:FlaG/FlaF family flagellin (archaellin)